MLGKVYYAGTLWPLQQPRSYVCLENLQGVLSRVYTCGLYTSAHETHAEAPHRTAPHTPRHARQETYASFHTRQKNQASFYARQENYGTVVGTLMHHCGTTAG